MLTFSVHFLDAGSLSITLLGPANKTLLHFSARASKGRTTFEKSLPLLKLKPQSHATLKIELKAAGKSYDIATRLKI